MSHSLKGRQSWRGVCSSMIGVWDSSSHILGEQEAESKREVGPGSKTSRSTLSDPLPPSMLPSAPPPPPPPVQGSTTGPPAETKQSTQASVAGTLQITTQAKQASSSLSEARVHSHCSLHRRQLFFHFWNLKGGSQSLCTFQRSACEPRVCSRRPSLLVSFQAPQGCQATLPTPSPTSAQPPSLCFHFSSESNFEF